MKNNEEHRVKTDSELMEADPGNCFLFTSAYNHVLEQFRIASDIGVPNEILESLSNRLIHLEEIHIPHCPEGKNQTDHIQN